MVYCETVKYNAAFKQVENELFVLRNLLREWRNFHLHLPRLDLGGNNDLGSNNVKSLIGSADAIDAVKKMQASATTSDPLNKIAEIYKLNEQPLQSELINYLESKYSLDTKIGLELGKVTDDRFKEVQERTGIFSQPNLFKNPPKREA